MRTAGSTPAPPTGFTELRRFAYPVPWLTLLAILVAPVAAAAFGALRWVAYGPALFDGLVVVAGRAAGPSAAVTLVPALAVGIVAVVLTAVAHEVVHGIALQLRDRRVEYGVASSGGVYASGADEFLTRRDVVVTLLAPLVALDAVGVALLLSPVSPIALGALVGLALNTAGATADLYGAVVVRRTPPGTLFTAAELGHSYWTVPLGADAP